MYNILLQRYSAYSVYFCFTFFFISFLFIGALRPVFAANCGQHNLSGYVWSSNIGWISLSCISGSTIDYGLDWNLGNGDFLNGSYAWSSDAGWIHFAPSSPFPGLPNNSANYNKVTGMVTGWAKVIGWGADGWIKLGPLSIGGTDYGMKVNPDKTTSGWAWNQDQGGYGAGVGWISFAPVFGGGSASVPFFKGEAGDIYGKLGVQPTQAPPSPSGNATYLIHSNGTISPTTAISEYGVNGTKTPVPIDFPRSSNSYTNVLGKLDRAGIIAGKYSGTGTPTNPDPGSVTTYNGNCGQTKTSNSAFGASVTLNDGVYYSQQKFVVDKPLTLKIGTGNNKGRGTIVVDCDLLINENIDYEVGTPNNRLDQLPSVAWIVKGNVIIDPKVTKVVGVFYVEDNGANTGIIDTGTYAGSQADVAFVANGAMIAKGFKFSRSFSGDSSTPSEKVLYDGRAWLNTPPGLLDITKAMPTFREVAP